MHIIQNTLKQRQLETLGTIKADDDDPLIKVSKGCQKSGKHASFDDELGGLSGGLGALLLNNLHLNY